MFQIQNVLGLNTLFQACAVLHPALPEQPPFLHVLGCHPPGPRAAGVNTISRFKGPPPFPRPPPFYKSARNQNSPNSRRQTEPAAIPPTGTAGMDRLKKKKKIPHTGNTWPSCMCVIQEYRFYTMSPSQYHGCCQYHESIYIQRVLKLPEVSKGQRGT